MNILNSNQMRLLDDFTIQNVPISSIDLMERAASKCVDWIETNINSTRRIRVVCGPGNNGGDGLAITRLLAEKGWSVSALILDSKNYLSNDCKQNLDRLTHRFPDYIQVIQNAEQLPLNLDCDVVIDAILGTGFKGQTSGLLATAIDLINGSDCDVISIDMPSGMASSEFSNIIENKIIKSSITITFQFLKPALVMPENAPFFGKVEVLDIGLDVKGLRELQVDMHLSDLQFIRGLLKPRQAKGHKGDFGH
ncbi:MAG: NAD(P)H-hydrate epimerase, partial [Bacteroidota bacterium]